MNQKCVFSIIIPHKNTPDLLQRCLDSIPRRDDIQIIVVDDNSDGNIVDFTHFPCLNDKHVEVYLTKEGKGAGYARNVGLTYAKGKWLLFADADDFFTENAFDCFFAQADSSHEIIYFKVTSCYSDTLAPAERDLHLNHFVDNFLRKTKDAEDILRYKWYEPFAKMLKRDFTTREHIRFEEVIAANDVMFSLHTGYYAKSIDAIDKVVYCITVSGGSITNTKSKKHMEAYYLARLRCNDFLRKHEKSRHQMFIIHYLILSGRYGLTTFVRFIGFAIRYASNPFFGMHRWLPFFFAWRKKQRNRKGCTVKAS